MFTPSHAALFFREIPVLYGAAGHSTRMAALASCRPMVASKPPKDSGWAHDASLLSAFLVRLAWLRNNVANHARGDQQPYARGIEEGGLVLRREDHAFDPKRTCRSGRTEGSRCRVSRFAQSCT